MHVRREVVIPLQLTPARMMERHIDDGRLLPRATYSTHAAVAKHGRQVVENVSPQTDQQILAAEILRLLLAATPAQTYYYNFHRSQDIGIATHGNVKPPTGFP